jgi:hypothetical protein
MGVYMKKVAFSIEGKRLEVSLEEEFANYLEEDLILNSISFDHDNRASELLRLYLKALKQNFDNQKQIEELISHITTFTV